MIKSTIKWRKEFKIDELLKEDFGDDLEKMVFMHGFSKEGHPVCYNVYGAFQDKDFYQQTFSDEEKRQRFMKWRIQLLEKSIRNDQRLWSDESDTIRSLNSSLHVQLGWFKSHLQSLCKHSSDCKHKLANALFIIETGGNDFNYAFFQQKSLQDVQQMVDEVIQGITSAVQEVISSCATQVVIPGYFPIGCMPIYLSAFQTNDLNMYDELHCLKRLNEFATFQNDHLQEAIRKLQEQHSKVAIVYANYYNALRELLKHAASLGFKKDEVQKTCCGISNNEYKFNMTSMCGYNGVPVCKHPYERVSWDGVHMTQHAYKLMARWLLKKNIIHGISTRV
ncbi:GDSL esterase/lipase At5g03980-like [Beta vulgaris subsp. vulgaris]|uniref:GDSL esterase/lipase At5g03980-like n=1 Tax=Beta vulgaris subsp. vulgaris TaxID=3555 RepID=UPI002547D116|nr:GDSL esterase/lipase At5g03980-like [Beta vulgaris subsp. vulgaris]